MTHASPIGDARGPDIVVMGGSAGALEALRDVVSQLPQGFSVAVFVVVHVLPSGQSRLPEILERSGWLPARHARNGDRIEPGRILVAPPDRHLLLRTDRVELGRGPRENSTRPALDPLFRSAAEAFGPRVCGVVLSGNLEDGSVGLSLIAAAGGLALVQDPAEAPHAEMPLNARRRVPAAEVLSALRIGRRLAGLDRSPAAAGGPSQQRLRAAADGEGGPHGQICPECGGVLGTEPDGGDLRCRNGHSYSLEALERQQAVSVEQAMRAAVRALREDASRARHMTERALASGNQHTAARFESRRRTARLHAEVLERLLFERKAPDEDVSQP